MTFLACFFYIKFSFFSQRKWMLIEELQDRTKHYSLFYFNHLIQKCTGRWKKKPFVSSHMDVFCCLYNLRFLIVFYEVMTDFTIYFFGFWRLIDFLGNIYLLLSVTSLDRFKIEKWKSWRKKKLWEVKII